MIIRAFICILISALAWADDTTVAKDAPKVSYQNPFYGNRPYYQGPTDTFETRNTSMRWREFQRDRVPLPVLQVRRNESLQLYRWSAPTSEFVPTDRAVAGNDRQRYYHNGIFRNAGDKYYFQMVEVGNDRRERVAGWLSSEQVLSPTTPSLLEKVRTEAGYVTRCMLGNCQAPENTIEQLNRVIPQTPSGVTQPMNEPEVPGQPSQIVCPIPGPHPVQKTCNHGMRRHPILGIMRMHQGIDLDSPGSNTPIVSMASGRVLSSGWAGGHGRRVVIQSDDGKIVSYSHLAVASTLPAEGARVNAGDRVGIMGTTGLSTGVHLHLEFYENKAKFDAKSSVDAPSGYNVQTLCGRRFQNLVR